MPVSGGNGIQQPLAHKGALIAAGGAVGAAGGLVGEFYVPDGAVGWHAVGAGQHRRGKIRHRGGVGAHISALIVKEFVVDGEDAPVAVDGGADVVGLLARMVGGDQVLAAVLDPFHRTPQPQRRDTNKHVFRIEFAADSESAADMAFEQIDAGRRTPQHSRNLIAVPVRHLGGAVHFQPIGRRIVATDSAAGFQRHAGVAADVERQADDGVRVAERGIDVAIFLADDRALARQPVGEFTGRCVGVQQRRKLLDLDYDMLGGVFGQIRIVGEYHGDGIADIAHPVASENGLAIQRERREFGEAKIDRRDVGDIGKAPGGVHA